MATNITCLNEGLNASTESKNNKVTTSQLIRKKVQLTTNHFMDVIKNGAVLDVFIRR